MAYKPRDHFEQYFAEKIWEMIPSVYRYEDTIAEKPGVLRALVEILAEQAAILRRSHDRLWEDQFIELCDNWAIPYLGDLLGTRLVSALNERAYRIDVAKTIYYRRRKGTLRVQEELISDIAGWEGKVVENFRRLARTRHQLDPKPTPLAGRLTGTLPGGWADLRHPRSSELVGGPFDEFYYTPDIRRHRGCDGRYSIPKLAFYLYRLSAFRVSGVTAYALEQNGYTFDPSGRDIPLFMLRNRPQDPDPKEKAENQVANWDAWRSAKEWELPAPMSCQVLNDDEGKKALIPDALQVQESPNSQIILSQIGAANLDSWIATPPTDMGLAIDPERGRLQFLNNPPIKPVIVTYCYGFSGEIGAGTYDRRAVEKRTEIDKPPLNIDTLPLSIEDRTPTITNTGGGALLLVSDSVIQLDDSASYELNSNPQVFKHLTLQAKNQQRPYLNASINCVFDTGAKNVSELLLDGLWIGIGNGPKGHYSLTLKGNYKQVIIRSCTFDPGEIQKGVVTIQPVKLIIEAKVEALIIESSILGPIYTSGDGLVEKLVIQDSIIQSIDAKQAALKLPQGEVHMRRISVFGTVDVNRLWATEALITENVKVTDTQQGCFRFSVAPPNSRLPHPYEHHEISDFKPCFTSERFGDPGYGQLSDLAPIELQRGAENGSEIGAFSYLLNPIRLDSLETKIDEYLPFGLIPIFISKT